MTPMSKTQQLLPISQLEDLYTAGAGYDIIRYVTLPELLGTEAKTLLYFMGRNLARNFDIQGTEDIYYTFDKMGWGKLELVKEKRKENVFQLMSDSIVRRIQASFDIEFYLEAGFLAEATQQLEKVDCECTTEINSKIMQVEFSVFLTD
jgi:predicted hydrocarbon binding protein